VPHYLRANAIIGRKFYPVYKPIDDGVELPDTMKRYLISADEAERKREEAGFRSLFCV
jgi:hypothetical protein